VVGLVVLESQRIATILTATHGEGVVRGVGRENIRHRFCCCHCQLYGELWQLNACVGCKQRGPRPTSQHHLTRFDLALLGYCTNNFTTGLHQCADRCVFADDSSEALRGFGDAQCRLSWFGPAIAGGVHSANPAAFFAFDVFVDLCS